MNAHTAENDAAKRGHHLTVTKSDDWFPDQHDWNGEVVCLAPALCGGWWECLEPHEVDGHSAAMGPYDDADEESPWFDQEEYEFHGVLHTWRYGHGWTIPYDGCVVQANDSVCDWTHEIGQQHGEGTYAVDDEWDGTDLTLVYVDRVLSPAVTAEVTL